MFPLITSIVCIVGIVCYYSHIPYILFIGALLDIIENFIDIHNGTQNNLATLILSIIIGLIVGLNTGHVFIGISLAICFESAIMFLLSIPMYVMILKTFLKK